MFKNLQEYKDSKRKLKKYKHKIEKLEHYNK
jgi:hypothetical protein